MRYTMRFVGAAGRQENPYLVAQEGSEEARISVSAAEMENCLSNNRFLLTDRKGFVAADWAENTYGAGDAVVWLANLITKDGDSVAIFSKGGGLYYDKLGTVGDDDCAAGVAEYGRLI